jgi:thymidylate kinase
MIIVFEGVDFTGKSTAAKLVAGILAAEYYKTPPKAYQDRRDEVDKNASEEDHYRFYLEATQAASQDLSALGPRLVIVDRYWMTTVAYHRAVGVDAKLSDFGAIVMPDVVVYLTVSDEEQQNRVNTGRAKTVCDERQLKIMPEVRAEYEALLRDHPKVLRVHTDGLTPDQVAAMIVNMLAL